MPRCVNKIQPSQANWNFPDSPPVPLSKPELLKLTIIMKIEMYYLTRRREANFHPDRKKSNISHAYRGSIVTFMACRYNSCDRGTQQQFSENICSEDHLRSRIFGTFVVKFLA